MADPKLLWPQGSTITISLLGMTNDQEQLMKDNINKWAPYTNLKFEFVNTKEGDIRIATEPETLGGWSNVGTSAKSIPIDKPTMAIGLQGDKEELEGAIIHEFGHALGLKHEHQHPDRQLPDSDYLLGFPTYPRTDVTTSKYDRSSVMHYVFSTKADGSSRSENNQISEGDKAFMRTLYPPITE
ncbi:hypothetical protein HKK54_16240 [Pseudomonas sp. ADAK13]|nr:hypothetical protein HKK54_16240 [Pseudomonas sp. ADAK13]